MRLLFLSLFVLFAACQRPPQSLPKQQLNLNIHSDPATFDPRKGGDVVSSMLHFLLYDGLTRLTVDGRPEPALAETIAISEDRMTYTFTLCTAFWSDGQPIRARDFEQSWKAILDPAFPAANAHLLYPIKNAQQVKKGLLPASELGLHAVDEKTLIVELEHPTPYFLELISFCVFFPVQADLKAEWEERVDTALLASGPFLLKEWKRNNEILLVKNPRYHRAETVHLPAIHISIVASETTALQMYEKGDLDILGHPLMPLPTEAIPMLAKSGQLQIRPVGATTFCSFNVNRFPFTSVKIRKAFAYAINRTEIVQNITQLAEEPALTIIPSVMKKTPQAALFEDANEREAALLFEAGLEELGITRAEFPKLVYHYTTSELQHKVAQALQQQWQKVLGVEVELQTVDQKMLMHQLKVRDYWFAQSSWRVQYNDPMNIFERFKYADNVKNYPGWENSHFMDCLTRSDHASTLEERALLLEEAERTMLEDMPLAPIFHWSSAFVAKDYVQNFNLAPLGNGFFDQISFAPKE